MSVSRVENQNRCRMWLCSKPNRLGSYSAPSDPLTSFKGAERDGWELGKTSRGAEGEGGRKRGSRDGDGELHLCWRTVDRRPCLYSLRWYWCRRLMSFRVYISRISPILYTTSNPVPSHIHSPLSTVGVGSESLLDSNILPVSPLCSSPSKSSVLLVPVYDGTKSSVQFTMLTFFRWSKITATYLELYDCQILYNLGAKRRARDNQPPSMEPLTNLSSSCLSPTPHFRFTLSLAG